VHMCVYMCVCACLPVCFMCMCICLPVCSAGIFQPHIMYLLCLTTPVDIILLGVSFVQTVSGKIPDNCAYIYLLNYLSIYTLFGGGGGVIAQREQLIVI